LSERPTLSNLAVLQGLEDKRPPPKKQKNCPPPKKIKKNKIKDIVFGRKNQKC
jgi:hypothetical protein